jgi:hypothetical protein
MSVSSTLFVVGYPVMMVPAVALGAVAVALCAAALLTRRGRRSRAEQREAPRASLASPYVPMERAR